MQCYRYVTKENSEKVYTKLKEVRRDILKNVVDSRVKEIERCDKEWLFMLNSMDEYTRDHVDKRPLNCYDEYNKYIEDFISENGFEPELYENSSEVLADPLVDKLLMDSYIATVISIASYKITIPYYKTRMQLGYSPVVARPL